MNSGYDRMVWSSRSRALLALRGVPGLPQNECFFRCEYFIYNVKFEVNNHCPVKYDFKIRYQNKFETKEGILIF